MAYELQHKEWIGEYSSDLLAWVEMMIEILLVKARDHRMAPVLDLAARLEISEEYLYKLAATGCFYREKRKVLRGNGQYYSVLYLDPREVQAFLSLDRSDRRAVRRGEMALDEASGWVLAPLPDDDFEQMTRIKWNVNADWLPRGRLGYELEHD